MAIKDGRLGTIDIETQCKALKILKILQRYSTK